MATLSLSSQVLGFGDSISSSQPKLVYVNWSRTQTQAVERVETQSLVLPALTTKTLWDTTRATTEDGTTSWDLAILSTTSNAYRLSWGAGTNPTLRTDKGVDVTGLTLTLTVLANATMTVVSGSGTPFASVVAGDQVFIPGVTTGDVSGPFDSLNEGFWTVLSATSTTMTLARDGTFAGASEVVVGVSAFDLHAFSSAGVQVGDTVQLGSGFAVANRGNFEISAVTADFVEFVSTKTMVEETGVVAGAAGINFYEDAKTWVRLEVDRDVAVRVNGVSGTATTLTPWQAGDSDQVAVFDLKGLVWALEIENLGADAASVNIFSTS